jgi:DNA-binding CsgD family transcriptional regulator
MGALHGSDVRALLDVVDDVESAATAGETVLTEAVLTGLASLVPSDTVWRAEVDYTLHRNDMLSSDGRVGPAYDARQSRWWELVGEHPIISHRQRTGMERALTLSDCVDRRALKRLQLYDEFFHPFGVEYSLSVRINLSSARAVDLGCTRAVKDFSERDRAILDVLRPLLAHLLRLGNPHPAFDDVGLTRREQEVLGLVATGLSNAEIAATLFIAAGTVKKHVDNIFKKLDVRNRTQASTWSLQRASQQRPRRVGPPTI